MLRGKEEVRSLQDTVAALLLITTSIVFASVVVGYAFSAMQNAANIKLPSPTDSNDGF